MSGENLSRRLDKLEEPETPPRQQYLDARERAMSYVICAFGAVLEPHEEHDLGPGYGEDNFAADTDVMARYRSSLDAERCEREQHGLLRRLYRELERRGVDPYMEDED
jgi:hypothetical protein